MEDLIYGRMRNWIPRMYCDQWQSRFKWWTHFLVTHYAPIMHNCVPICYTFILVILFGTLLGLILITRFAVFIVRRIKDNQQIVTPSWATNKQRVGTDRNKIAPITEDPDVFTPNTVSNGRRLSRIIRSIVGPSESTGRTAIVMASVGIALSFLTLPLTHWYIHSKFQNF